VPIATPARLLFPLEQSSPNGRAGLRLHARRSPDPARSAPADPERVLAHMSSISWIVELPEPERADVLARMRAIIQAGETPERFALHVEVGLTTLLE
jgi:hypothetical protein